MGETNDGVFVTVCPTCSQEVPLIKGLELRVGVLFSRSGSTRLGPLQTTIVRALLRGPLTTTQLVEQIYSSVPEPPLFPNKTINATIFKLRSQLPAIGWDVVNVGVGFGGGSIYRLEEKVPELNEV